MLSGESRDGGPTASSSRSGKRRSILVQKCVRCDEGKTSVGLERRKKTLKWLLHSPEAPLEEEPQNVVPPDDPSNQ